MTEAIRRFTVREAVLSFCFEQRIEDVNAAEQYFRSQEVVEFGYPTLGAASNRGAPTPCSPRELGAHRRALDAAWRNVLLDLKTRIERGDLVLSAVEISPDLKEKAELIPGQWAMALSIDPLRSTVSLRQTRYVNALLVRQDQAKVTTDPSVAAATRIDPGSVDKLDEDTIVALLEEYYSRVIAGSVEKLMPPGKVTLIPLIRGKMRRRAAQGELLPTLSAEAQWLASWIAERATLHHVSKAATIGKMLGSDYALLKARSKPAI